MSDVFSFTQRSILVGSLLGDGSLSKPRSRNGNSSFVKPQTAKRREYLEWHYSSLEPFSTSLTDCDNEADGKVYRRSIYRTKAMPCFTTLRSQWYPDGVKIVPRAIKLDPLSIAIWFFDDGSNSLKDRCCRFATYAFSKDDCEFLCGLLADHQINAYVGDRNVIKVRTESYKTLVDLVSSYMLWPCFEHKIVYRDPEFRMLTDDEARLIVELAATGLSQVVIAARLGIGNVAVSDVLRGRTKRHLKLVGKSVLSCANTSGEKNIRFDPERQKWVVFVSRKGKKFQSRFVTKELAVAARDEFLRNQA